MAPNPIITTIQDFDPNKIVLTRSVRDAFQKAVKNKLSDGSFELEKSLASKLKFQSLIQDHVAGRDENRNQIYTGRYVLDVFGVLYIEHLEEAKKNVSIARTDRWITRGIAILALLISLASLGWQMWTYCIKSNQDKNMDIQREQTDTIIESTAIITDPIKDGSWVSK